MHGDSQIMLVACPGGKEWTCPGCGTSAGPSDIAVHLSRRKYGSHVAEGVSVVLFSTLQYLPADGQRRVYVGNTCAHIGHERLVPIGEEAVTAGLATDPVYTAMQSEATDPANTIDGARKRSKPKQPADHTTVAPKRSKTGYSYWRKEAALSRKFREEQGRINKQNADAFEEQRCYNRDTDKLLSATIKRSKEADGHMGILTVRLSKLEANVPQPEPSVSAEF